MWYWWRGVYCDDVLLQQLFSLIGSINIVVILMINLWWNSTTHQIPSSGVAANICILLCNSFRSSLPVLGWNWKQTRKAMAQRLLPHCNVSQLFLKIRMAPCQNAKLIPNYSKPVRNSEGKSSALTIVYIIKVPLP